MPTETKTTTMPLVPSTLTVVLADTQASSCADMNENEQRPYRRRTVQIKLTEEQRQALTPRYHRPQQREADARRSPAGMAGASRGSTRAPTLSAKRGG